MEAGLERSDEKLKRAGAARARRSEAALLIPPFCLKQSEQKLKKRMKNKRRVADYSNQEEQRAALSLDDASLGSLVCCFLQRGC